MSRFRKWVERKGWWSDEAETRLRANIRKQVRSKGGKKLHPALDWALLIISSSSSLQLVEIIGEAEKLEKPPIRDLFTDVYDTPPSNLVEQRRQLVETVRRNPGCYPSDVPLSDGYTRVE